MIKYLFSDLDGTLLNPEGVVSATNVAAITASDLPMTLVSARAPIEMLAPIQALHLNGPQIAFNGGLVFTYENEQITPLQMHPLEQNRARMLLEFIQTSFPKVSLSCYTQDHWYTEHVDRGVLAEQQLTGQQPTIANYETLLADETNRCFKIMIMTLDTVMIQKLAADLKALNYADISVKLSGQTYLEITSDLAQKSSGIAFIKDYYHLQTAETAAFGDGENDLPMFKSVGTAIVMANATPDIQQVGHWVTKSNADDGVAYAIQNYVTEG
ncbi:HAD family hydrolase [Lactiplantibacillus fabifermentans]|uniref:Cof-like hydrolase family protein n=2 Tax=Lactiplantibacillus fabifermentans TaxID=483011 RepID=A0A0R2NVG9_9LACO|nr:HAD family hydrolase [Lactiplantibacillus fabifermentans]ETY73246.1 HAD family hydrolase [Lactiplantibacillus fabifermentans T30PCM01]KRO28320.1 Cof-like hydrolase family protein [Lactiplantibacillus fabifermentans DSM 21115]